MDEGKKGAMEVMVKDGGQTWVERVVLSGGERARSTPSAESKSKQKIGDEQRPESMLKAGGKSGEMKE